MTFSVIIWDFCLSDVNKMLLDVRVITVVLVIGLSLAAIYVIVIIEEQNPKSVTKYVFDLL